MSMTIYSQIEANKTKTWLIMVVFTLFITMLAYVFGKATGYGTSFIGLALIISGFLSFGSYYYSDKIVLKLSGAREADRKKDFDLYTVSENLAIAAGMPKPRIYTIEDSALNAFATGRDPDHAVICVTEGLKDKLDRRELEAVLAHELSHIQNYDTRLLAVVSILVGTIALLSDWFSRSLWWQGKHRDDKSSISSVVLIVAVILAILSPFIATLIQLAVSRRREFLADANGALLTRNPDALANALEKISKNQEVLEVATNATAHLYIINPFKGKEFSAWFASLFNTHPPIEERIKILRAM